MARPKNHELREFILRNVREHAGDIVPYTAKMFGVSRASANLYMRGLISEKLIEARGRTNARHYRLKALDTYTGEFPIGPGLREDVVLREHISPHLKCLPSNIVHICEYGFSEMLNNVIDHSEGTLCKVRFSRDYALVKLEVLDNGVGIFDKIARECHLADKREAILELSKGKLTTDSSKHTGEGIFFTSRMFDRFTIMSGDLRYRRTKRENDEWLVESKLQKWLISSNFGKEFERGTCVVMEIPTDSSLTTKEVFDKYVDDNYRFSRTHVPLVLAKYEGENLVSRSQARRLLARVERFSEVILDFRGINEIGQAFADEIFRVWTREHSNTKVVTMGVSADVQRMIGHAMVNAADQEAAAAQKPAK